ncbi:MAG: GNAT family N-acetyltransferase [Candidatus Obscuribacter sp.]|nr:GNAT family N-acetyltransferase [Candidatus Obscuribacter sp.]
MFERSSPDTVIGAANINNIVKGAYYYDALCSGIAKDKEYKKIMKEALQSVITYGFSAFNLHRIMANYQPVNDRSGQLLRSLGFSVEGYARDYLIINGKWCDHILTSIINPNWVKP